MSTLLDFEYFEVPLGDTITQQQQAIDGYIVAAGWQQLLQDTTNNISDFIPPSGEDIGNAYFREVVRIYYTGTSITIGGYQVAIADAIPQSFRLYTATAGAITPAITINGTTVSGATGTSSSTSDDNLRSLYYALIDSAEANVTAWSFEYDGSSVVATCKTIQAAITISGASNVTYMAIDEPVLSGARSGFVNVTASYGYGITVSLITGYILYLQINARSIIMSSKTTNTFYGPVFASYIDHTLALESIPDGWRCSPIELIMGSSDTWKFRTTHTWGITSSNMHHAITSSETHILTGSYDYSNTVHPFSGGAVPLDPSDFPLAYTQSLGAPGYALENSLSRMGIGLGRGASGFTVNPLGCNSQGYSVSNSAIPSSAFLPPVVLPDILAWEGAQNSELLALARSLVTPGRLGSTINLAQTMDATTNYASLTLSSVAGLPAQGYLVIEGEIISYTGISSPDITGVARGLYGSTKHRHVVGSGVDLGTWFVKINGGAMMAGNTKPT